MLQFCMGLTSLLVELGTWDISPRRAQAGNGLTSFPPHRITCTVYVAAVPIPGVSTLRFGDHLGEEGCGQYEATVALLSGAGACRKRETRVFKGIHEDTLAGQHLVLRLMGCRQREEARHGTGGSEPSCGGGRFSWGCKMEWERHMRRERGRGRLDLA